jgi:hypothetical protein
MSSADSPNVSSARTADTKTEVSPALRGRRPLGAWRQFTLLNPTRPFIPIADSAVSGARAQMKTVTDRATDHPGLRSSHQQGCGATHSGGSVPAETRFGGAVLAHDPWSHEGQSVESGSVSLRIGRPTYALGARGDGPMDAAHRGLRRAPRRRGWRRAVSHVQSSDSSPTGADLPQLGP